MDVAEGFGDRRRARRMVAGEHLQAAVVGRRLADDQHRPITAMHHGPRHAAKHEVLQATMAAGPHHHHVGLPLCGGRKDADRGGCIALDKLGSRRDVGGQRVAGVVKHGCCCPADDRP